MTDIYHPDGSDCDYCTYTEPCVTIKNTLPAPLKNMVPNNNPAPMVAKTVDTMFDGKFVIVHVTGKEDA